MTEVGSASSLSIFGQGIQEENENSLYEKRTERNSIPVNLPFEKRDDRRRFSSGWDEILIKECAEHLEEYSWD